ncbi:MAG: nickel-dependent lactate racemase [Desulfuromonadales bacterium]|nr:nickel-dependent lactate racemase [Desulfuromonadales bacterium]
MDTFTLNYGHSTFACRLPGARLLTAAVPPAPAPPAALVRQALEQPIGSPRLEEIVRAGEKVVIVTSDITRYTGSEHYLPIVVERLNALGVPDADLEILIALGIHRPQTEAEHRKIVGPLFGRIRVTDHDCDNPAELVTLGITAGGVPVTVNRRVAEADRVIVTGTVGFHYFAGFGGGRKGLVPGVASRATCMATHFSVLNPPEVGGKHPQATTAVLEGNPVHAAVLEAARMIAPDFLLNTVLAPDKEVLAVFTGDLEAAHLAGCEMVRRLYAVALEAPADLAVVSCGGAPKDINFIQAHKALDYGVGALRDGGTIILLAACPDGFGNKTFFSWFRHRELAEFETALRDHYEINGQTAYSTRLKADRYRIILISDFGQEETRGMGMEKAADLDEALRLAFEKLPPDPRIVVIPDGGTVLPIVGRTKSDRSV